VDFTGSLTGMLGCRTAFFGHPASVEASYKTLRYKLGRGGSSSTSATLNRLFIGLTGHW
jgi:hypothetical protein